MFLLFMIALGGVGCIGFLRERADAQAAETGPDLQNRLSTIVHDPDSIIPRSEMLH